MKRIALVLGISLFAACGDNGNPDNAVCGDGIKAAGEQCDDGNTTSGDGCSSTCATESAPACGDHHVDTGEECDDGNTTDGDGCSADCMNEAPGPQCGDHHVDTGEQCDDGNTTNGDGCSSTCQNETPAVVCGNGVIETGETCDDNNTAAGDGCSATCAVEMDYMCSGMPSVCTLTPGAGTCAMPFNLALSAVGSTYVGTAMKDTSGSTNQVAQGACDGETAAGGGKDQIFKFVNPAAQRVVIRMEGHDIDALIRLTTTACDVGTQIADDDTDTDNEADGCSDLHASGTGEVLTYNNLPAGTYYIVADSYSSSTSGAYTLTVTTGMATCGNGVLESGETCDDNNTTANDGCGATCTVDTGWTCTGMPSTCTHTCGNGAIDTGETCDDNNSMAGDGCDAGCHIETGYTCSGTPSVCLPRCGNGILDSGETCDDHNGTAGDGCSATCLIETGYACTGTPSTCTNSGGTCAMPYALTLALIGNQYIGVGMSDDTASTDQVTAGMCETETSAGAGKDHQWVIVNPVAQPLKITLVGSATSFDGVLRLMTTACDKATQIPDNDSGGVADGCSDRHASGTSEVLTYNNLPAGTYYLDVDGYGTSGQGKYRFTVQAGPLCGNGALDTGETCDDSNGTAADGCSATCQIESGYVCTGSPSVCHVVACGDGIIDTGEVCDDHNTTAGDGCSATCQVEPNYICTGTPSVCHAITCGDGVAEGTEECDAGGTTSMYCDAGCVLLFDTSDTEDNSTGALAQTITPTHHIIKGALPMNDLDVYKFTLTTASVVKIETYTTYAQAYTNTNTSGVPHLSCPTGTADTEVSIFSDMASVSATDPSPSTTHDDDSGDNACSYLVSATLAAGTYYFTVHDYNGLSSPLPLDPIARYLVDFSVTP